MLVKHRYCASVTAMMMALATPALSQNVTIETVDGLVSLKGKIISFDGEAYDFESAIGRTLIPAKLVVCNGDACPEIDDGTLLAGQVSVLDKPAKSLLLDLVNSFAADKGWDMDADANGLLASSIAFARDNNSVSSTLDIAQDNQRDAFEALLAGKSKFILSTAPISNDLADELVAAGHPDFRDPGREVIVALDAITPIVHPDNNIRDLSVETIARIAAGRIENWSELGGPDLAIRMVLPDEATSIAQVVNDRIMRPNRLRISRLMERVGNEADATAIINTDPAAITLTSAALADGVKQLPLREVCGPLSVATEFAIKAEEYPLARRLYLYTSEQSLSQSQKEFLSFAGSAEAQAQLHEFGFFGQTVEDVPMTLQGSRLASAILQTDTPEIFERTRKLMETLTSADRLSTTFRFEPGSSDLDNKSLRDAVRVSDYLAQPENAEREILLLGFTDSVGRSDLNDLLSLQQALKIKEAILNASAGRISEDRIVVTSYGSIAPVGCNTTAEGRYSNRRVEVWLN